MNREKRSIFHRRDILQVLLVTIATVCLWLLFASQFNIQEIIAALIAGLLAGAAGYILRVGTHNAPAGRTHEMAQIPSRYHNKRAG